MLPKNCKMSIEERLVCFPSSLPLRTNPLHVMRLLKLLWVNVTTVLILPLACHGFYRSLPRQGNWDLRIHPALPKPV